MKRKILGKFSNRFGVATISQITYDDNLKLYDFSSKDVGLSFYKKNV